MSSEVEFNHVLMYVEDVARSMKFYRDLLGFLLVEGEEDYARLKSPKGSATIGLHKLTEENVQLCGSGDIRLYFEVENLDSFCDGLSKSGVVFDQMPKDMSWGWRHAYLRDPDEHGLSLYHAGEKRLRTGKPV